MTVFIRYSGATMLPQRHRLPKQYIPLPRLHTRVYHADHITLAVFQDTSQKATRCAVIVSKKGLTAPERNMLRRRGYEAIGIVYTRLSPGYLCMFSLKKGVNRDFSYQVMIEEIETLCTKAGIISS